MAEDPATYECMRTAGRDPEVLHSRRLLVAGGGNAGSNAASTLSVLGIETAYVDPDRVEQKNLPHSPFLYATALPDGSRPLKAEILAQAHIAHSQRPDQVAHWASLPIQAIPLGVIRRFDGLLVGIDDGPSRAWAAYVGATLGIPTIVVGFFPPTGHFVATSNRKPDGSCYFCLRPGESRTRASCSRYSDPTGGVNPALQTAAAATMNVAIEAMTRFWQEDFRYDAKVFRLDLGEGSAELSGFRRNPDCRGPHEQLRSITSVPFGPDALAGAVLDLARADGLKRPVLELPNEYAISLPCRSCGRPVQIEQPDWAVLAVPFCRERCGGRAEATATHVEGKVALGSALASRSLRSLGLGPLGLCIVEDADGDEVRVYELPGKMSDALRTVTRGTR